MYTIRVTAHDKKNLPAMMLEALEHRRVSGLLDGLIHAEDDIVQEVDYGFEMISFWNAPLSKISIVLSKITELLKDLE